MARIEAEQRRIAADETRTATALRVSLVSIVGNSLLSLFKLLAGIFAHSGAMISDAVHSASDVLSSIIVIIGVRFAAKEADREHPYGHERFEPVSAIVLAVVLLVTGLLIGYRAVGSIAAGSAADIKAPGRLALVAALVSIVCKEAMFWYTRRHAKRIDSGALMAEAWHHRSDALSSVGALVGIAGARLGHPALDPLASLVICAFIAKAAFDIFRDALEKMVDHACSEETEQAIRACAEEQEGVLGVDLLQTRQFGSRAYVDVEIAADGAITLSESHEIAERVHEAIETRFPQVKHIMVHVNPK
ncbi:MAG: cation transporter [Oscillospiraceae bacterium]|nr:cation transporter [Oscillospiraceae bacterium]